MTSNHLSSIRACAHQSAADPGQIVLFWNDSPPRRAGTLLICQPQIGKCVGAPGCSNFRLWHLADTPFAGRMSAFDSERTSEELQCMPDEMISTMRAATPTTGPSLPGIEAGTAPFNPASSCFRPFCRFDPADPFIAREGRNILPRLQRFCVRGQCSFQVRGQVMDHTA